MPLYGFNINSTVKYFPSSKPYFLQSNSKQTTSLLESQEENEDLVPTGLWAIVAYIFLANLYIISPPIPQNAEK